MARVLSPDARGDLTLEIERNVEGRQCRFRLIIPLEYWTRLLRTTTARADDIRTNQAAYQVARRFWDHLVKHYADQEQDKIDVLFDSIRVMSREWENYTSLEEEFDAFRLRSR